MLWLATTAEVRMDKHGRRTDAAVVEATVSAVSSDVENRKMIEDDPSTVRGLETFNVLVDPRVMHDLRRQLGLSMPVVSLVATIDLVSSQ